jgi:hydrogenase-4 component F
VAAACLVLLAAAFLAMGATVMRVVPGPDPDGDAHPGFRDSLATAGPPLAMLLLVLALGLWVPQGLRDLFDAAASAVRG